MSEDEENLATLRRRVADGEAVIVVGTGVSIAASGNHPAASWVGLLETGLKRAGDHGLSEREIERHLGLLKVETPEMPHLLEAARVVTETLGGVHSKHFRNWLEDTIGKIRAKDTTLLDVLHTLRDVGNLLATTNYDDLLTKDRNDVRILTWEDFAEFGIQNTKEKRKGHILFLHGDAKSPASVVLAREDYDKLLLSKLGDRYSAFVNLWRSTTWVYVGCGLNGLNDPDFGFLQALEGASARKDGRWDYCLVRNGKERQDAERYFRDHKMNIRAVTYGDDHRDLPAFLRSLINPSASRPSSTKVAPSPVSLGPPINRWWSEVAVSGKHYRVFADASGVGMAPSHDLLAPTPANVSLVVDPEGRAAAWLRDGVLKVTWLSRARATCDPWKWKSRRQSKLVDARLLALSISESDVVAAVTNGGKTFLLRVVPEASNRIALSDLGVGASRGAIMRGAKEPILVDASSGVASAGDLFLGIEGIECVDEANTRYGRVRAAVGLSAGRRVLAIATDAKGARVDLDVGAPEGLAVVRNTAAPDVVVLYADKKVFRFTSEGHLVAPGGSSE